MTRHVLAAGMLLGMVFFASMLTLTGFTAYVFYNQGFVAGVEYKEKTAQQCDETLDMCWEMLKDKAAAEEVADTHDISTSEIEPNTSEIPDCEKETQERDTATRQLTKTKQAVMETKTELDTCRTVIESIRVLNDALVDALDVCDADLAVAELERDGWKTSLEEAEAHIRTLREQLRLFDTDLTSVLPDAPTQLASATLIVRRPLISFRRRAPVP